MWVAAAFAVRVRTGLRGVSSVDREIPLRLIYAYPCVPIHHLVLPESSVPRPHCSGSVILDPMCAVTAALESLSYGPCWEIWCPVRAIRAADYLLIARVYVVSSVLMRCPSLFPCRVYAMKFVSTHGGALTLLDSVAGMHRSCGRQ